MKKKTWAKSMSLKQFVINHLLWCSLIIIDYCVSICSNFFFFFWYLCVHLCRFDQWGTFKLCGATVIKFRLISKGRKICTFLSNSTVDLQRMHFYYVQKYPKKLFSFNRLVLFLLSFFFFVI